MSISRAYSIKHNNSKYHKDVINIKNQLNKANNIISELIIENRKLRAVIDDVREDIKSMIDKSNRT
jgi:hypothetical protein